MNTKSNSFIEGPIFPLLIKFSIPLLLSLLLQGMYGAVDLLIVGQFGDATGVSAVSTGSQIIQTITGIITGLTMGATVLLGQYMGARKEKEAGDAVGATIWIFSIMAVIITILMVIFTKPLVTLMNAPKEAYDKTVAYVLICSLGTIFIVAYNGISGIFRGIGNSKLPLIFVAIACVTNIIGDLFFVCILNMDSKGVAIATVIAQAVSVILSMYIIRKNGLPFKFRRENIRFNKVVILEILKLGSPIALQDALTNISFLILTSILNTMGLIVSAGVGVAEKVVIFIMLIPLAFMSSISAFVAQNIGANKLERAKKSMIYGMIVSSIFGSIMFIFTFTNGEILAGIFAKETPVIIAAAQYLKAYAIDCILVCFLFSFMGFFNGCGKTVFVMIQGIIAAFLVRIPFSYFMSRLEGATMFEIGLASPVATACSIIICLIYFKSGRWKKGIENII